ncbi:MAG: HEAT repeat domain-containing protein [Nitrospirota bacterium]|nr:HEAT repeat domain-containing protein [Nitrospirota bacterium]
MTETQEQNECKGPAPAGLGKEASKELPLDMRLLSDAVIELNISRKNVGIYPPGHVQIEKSITRAYEALLKLFEVAAQMTLGVAKDTLFVGQDYLDRLNPVYRDFALSLSRQGIAAVTFCRGLDEPELVRFHRIITTRPEEIKSRGGIAAAVEESDTPHILITPIDYAGFHVTDEQEVRRDGSAGPKGEEGVGLWGDFVSHLSAGNIAVAGKDVWVALKDAEQADPAELARLLNERKLDPQAVLQSYDRVISSHVRVRAEQKQLNRGQTDTLRSLNSLLKDLHPDLRKQFLAVTFERTVDASPAVTEEVMGGMTDDMVIDMLQQANAQGHEISPTLTGLLQKLASARYASAGTAAGGEAASGEPIAPLSQDQVQALFNRENYEQYVSPEYQETLTRVSGGQREMPAAGEGAFPIEEYAATMTEERLDYQIGKVLLGFIDADVADDDYGEFLKKAVSNLPELVRSEQFALLHDTYETLRSHSREKKSAANRSMADYALCSFRTPEFIGSVAEAWIACTSREKAKVAANFLLSLGKDALPLLLDIFSRDEAAGGRRPVFDLLCRFGNAAVQEAVKRLDDKRPLYVRNLLMLIRWGWDASVVNSIRPLARHKERQVRLEAVTALLRFHDAAAIPALRALIADDDPDVAAQAAAIAGQYRVRAVVDLLHGKLKKAIFFESDYRDNEDVIRVLGEIGDTNSVPELERIAKGGWPLFPQSRDRMKAVLFESLGRYPRSDIAGLIAIGMQSGNPRIMRAASRLRVPKP